ncbi:unnamed protein product, partial [Coregonus sp. 'balchen']
MADVVAHNASHPCECPVLRGCFPVAGFGGVAPETSATYLINNHKSIHGDAPSSSGQQWHPARPPARGRSHSSFFTPTFPSRGGPYSPQHTGHWRKTYSLSSKTSSSQHSRPTTQTAKPSLEQHLDSAAPKSSTGFLSLHAAGTLLPSHSSKDSNHSKFTWVKSHQSGGAGPSLARTESQPPEKLITSVTTAVSHPGVPISFSPSPSSNRKAFAPRKKVPRRLSLSTAVPKTSKYTWVSSSAGAQARLSRKHLSPKALALALSQRAAEKGEGVAKKPKSPNLLAKQRKAAGASSSTLSSRYRWKAGSGGGGQTGSGTGSRGGSVFRWTSEKENGSKGGSSVLPSVTQCTVVLPASSSPVGSKLRSRMKIIRRSFSSGSGAEWRSSPAATTLNSCYSLRRRTHTAVRTQTAVRTHTLVRSPGAVKRTPSLELVSFGRHNLRRLSPVPPGK